HQHWHLYYLDFELELESIQCEKGILKDWPIPAFVFKVKELKIFDIEKVVEDAFKFIDHCIENSLAYNLFITRMQLGDVIRIFFWIQPPELDVKDNMSTNPVFCSGLF
ncbi:GDP-D-glucose phosphorylase 1-like protein, partial [Dinothrombium tinctorium]